MINPSKQIFSNELVKYIISRTAGTHPDDEIITSTRPSRKFIIGTLAAKKPKDLLSSNEDENRASIRAQRLKISILVDRTKINKSSEISLNITGNVYYQFLEKKDNKDLETKIEVNPNSKKKTPNKDIQKWKRLAFSDNWNFKLFEDDSIKKSQTQFIDFSSVILQANNDPLIKNQKVTNNIWKAEISALASEFDTKNLIINIYPIFRRSDLKNNNFHKTSPAIRVFSANHLLN